MNNQNIARLLRKLADEFAAEGQTLEELIKACNFSWVSGDITPERFPIRDIQSFTPVLIHPNKYVSTEEAMKLVKKEGSYGTTAQFLKYLADNPGAGMEYPIAHLDSECVASSGGRCCLYVNKDGQKRSLNLILLEHDWSDYWRFFGAAIS